MFENVKVGHILSVHVEGERKLVRVASVVDRTLPSLDGGVETVKVAVTHGAMQFRLDNGFSLVPPKAWVIARMTPLASKRSRLSWAYGEQPE